MKSRTYGRCLCKWKHWAALLTWNWLKLPDFMGIHPSAITRQCWDWVDSYERLPVGSWALIQICCDLMFLENSRALQDFNTAHSQEDWSPFCRLKTTQTAKLHPQKLILFCSVKKGLCLERITSTKKHTQKPFHTCATAGINCYIVQAMRSPYGSMNP